MESDCFYIESAFDSCLVLSIEKSKAADAPAGARVVWRKKDGSSSQLWKGNYTYSMSATGEMGQNAQKKSFTIVSAVKKDMVIGIEGSNYNLALRLQSRKTGENQAWTVRASCKEKNMWILSPYSQNDKVMIVQHHKESPCETRPPEFSPYSHMKKAGPQRMYVRIKDADCTKPPLPADPRLDHGIQAGTVYKIERKAVNGTVLRLAVEKDLPAEGARIVFRGPKDRPGEYWKAVDAGGGFFYFESLLDRGKVLTCGSSNNNLASVNLASKNQSAAQMWQPRVFEGKKWVDRQTQVMFTYVRLFNKGNNLSLGFEGTEFIDGVKVQGNSVGSSLDFTAVSAEEEKTHASPMVEGYCYTLSQSLAITGFMEDPELGKAGISLLANDGDSRTWWQFIPVTGEWGLLMNVEMGNKFFMTANFGEKGSDGSVPVTLSRCRFYEGNFDSPNVGGQLWRIIPAADNRFRFENKVSKGSFIAPGAGGRVQSDRRLFLKPDEAGNQTSWILRRQEAIPPISVRDLNCTKPEKQFVTLQKLECIKKQATGTDDIYLKVSVDGGPKTRYPYNGTQQMNTGDIWEANLTWKFDHNLTIEVWEHDGQGAFFPGADLVGVASIQSDKSAGAIQKEFYLNGHYRGGFSKITPDGSIKEPRYLRVDKFLATDFETDALPWDKKEFEFFVDSDLPGQEPWPHTSRKLMKKRSGWNVKQEFAFYESINVKFVFYLNDRKDTLILSQMNIEGGSSWPSGDYHRGNNPIYFHSYPSNPGQSAFLYNTFTPGEKKDIELVKTRAIISEFHSFYTLQNDRVPANSPRLPKLKITKVKCLRPSNSIDVNSALAARDWSNDMAGNVEDYWDLIFLTGSWAAQLALYINEKHPGDDEIVLLADGRKIWPTDKEYHKMNKDDEVSPNITVPGWHRGRSLGLSESGGHSNGHLGSFSIDPAISSQSRTHTILSTQMGAIYEVTFSVEE